MPARVDQVEKLEHYDLWDYVSDLYALYNYVSDLYDNAMILYDYAMDLYHYVYV
jgi:hypothetical protein